MTGRTTTGAAAGADIAGRSTPYRRAVPGQVTPWTGQSFGRLRIGLLGGSFNPAHPGHRHITLLALRRLGLDAVWWLVSPQNPLKARAGMAPMEDRIAHAGSVARHPGILVTGVEQTLGTRFTTDTIRRLKTTHPQCRFVWIMGADNLVQMDRWSRWRRLFQDVPIAVMTRRPYSLTVAQSKAASAFARCRLPEDRARCLPGLAAPAWVLIHGPEHPGSATSQRQGLALRRKDVWTMHV